MMTKEKFEQIKDVSNRYQNAKAKQNFMIVIFCAVMVLGNMCFGLENAAVKILCIIGVALHDIMFMVLFFRLQAEKKQCMKEMSELGVK